MEVYLSGRSLGERNEPVTLPLPLPVPLSSPTERVSAAAA